jgi:E3 ubiquitin-protein ligase HERC3
MYMPLLRLRLTLPIPHCALQLVEIILRQCSPPQLGMLEATCSYFHGNKLIEKIAKQKLRTVPRAKGLKPARK